MKRPPRGFVLGLLILLITAIGVISAACASDPRSAEATICLTPEEASLYVEDSQHLTVTITLEHEGRKLNEESGWRWVWDSDDGGEITLSSVELEWGPPFDGVYVAQVDCTAVKAGTVTVKVGQPADQSPILFLDSVICLSSSCTLTII